MARESAQLPRDVPSLWVWGHCIEMLWEMVMQGDSDTREYSSLWSSLTSRLLLWNVLCGGASQVGEWARMEAIKQTMQTAS